MKKTENVIEIKDLKKAYVNEEVETQVLHGVSFTIPRGEFVSIMGPSGSGKSTLMQILGLLDTPSSGEFLFDGKKVSGLEDDELSTLRGEKIGFIFQAFNLLPKTSVLENVMLPLLYSDVPVAKRVALAKKAIATVGLTHRTENLSNQLSGGERQRVAIARAILKNAPILILDEATSSLDSHSEALIQDALNTLMKDKTVIVIAHRLSTIAKMDRIVVVDGGKIIEQGSHGELLQNENSLYKKLWTLQAGGFLDDEDKEEPVSDDSLDEEKESASAESFGEAREE
jgi:putative ABC transport system ATP-binding protein